MRDKTEIIISQRINGEISQMMEAHRKMGVGGQTFRRGDYKMLRKTN